MHRRNFRRSVSIYLYPNKPIKVVAAKSTPQKVIVDFLMAKKDWIEKNFEKFQEIAEKFPDKKIKAYENFPFKGKERKLKVVITLHKKTFVSITDEHLLLHIPRNDWSANSLIEEHPTALKEIRHFYKREAVDFLSERVKFWAGEMNLHPSQVKFREQKTRWGSCSSRKVINLNWRLIVFTQEIIDYVIVHELAHLQHMNHSSHFWGLVEKYVENYKDIVKTMKESQYLVEFLSET
ncbi:YgjP family zinc-dependent metalloprotease [Bdellovibrio bacteriovorus]|uniref:Putative zinc metallo protease n=1 Tax=Bdellovibrio bacteriovorus str. Tiberius TaxID=1069642 RepID=K7Z2C7_BDEBC|nr:SprT family zinc-dependent metalloprotease [Bdellovibrio bacteriovorus]AFY03270.1 putative zinc metallo protease [Bdellovibrio bacteriovorus str. Tiberius]